MLRGFLAIAIILLMAGAFSLRLDLASLWRAPAPIGSDAKGVTGTERSKVAKSKLPPPRPLAEVDRAAAPDSAKFDVVRVDPDGASVFAGRAPANAQVTVFANGQAIASAKANKDGEWSTVIERQFASGDYQLSVRSSGSGAETAGQSVKITIASTSRPAATDTKLVAPAIPKPAPVPAPITFVYDESAFTAVGRKEAMALAEFLRRQQLKNITLTGHADERGSDEFNMELSRKRLETVAIFLRETGYGGKLTLVPMGSREPFSSPTRCGALK
jgi:outer membrane protein OmpA-like peptidoglycan-associated protein